MPERQLIQAAKRLSKEAAELHFEGRVYAVYNPLDYAWLPHRLYLERYGRGRKRVVFVGMNPGPWGMAQTGVPFGEVNAVREWLGIDAPVSTPEVVHPKRPILGFSCPRSEVSGRRFWGLMADRFGSAGAFFDDHYVINYCPLLFLHESGRNLTPDYLPKHEAVPLLSACDRHLNTVLETLQPEWVVGVGKYALSRLDHIAGNPETGWILHPSPANPIANRGWAEAASSKLSELGIW